jgi:hypothetical protein
VAAIRGFIPMPRKATTERTVPRADGTFVPRFAFGCVGRVAYGMSGIAEVAVVPEPRIIAR